MSKLITTFVKKLHIHLVISSCGLLTINLIKMENVFKLINNRLHNLEAVIKQHRYCIDNNIAITQYEDNLIKMEKEYDGLKKEYEELKQYCIRRKM